jgi:hypothetical protein
VVEAEEGDNMGYRICKNKYGYYKIQRQQKKIKLFGITFRKEWVDYYQTVFNTQEEAQEQTNRLIKSDQQRDKSWVCV